MALALLTGCARDRPNVLLVVLDTVRADRLGCYGYPKDVTPVLDALAADGVRFDLAVSTAGLTMVSHASLFTGLYPPDHGLRVVYAESGYRLDERIPTLATVLGRNGWSTQAFLSSFAVSDFFGLHQGFESVDDGVEKDPASIWRKKREGLVSWDLKNQRRSDRTTDRFLEWLPQAREPFFTWIHYWDPHDTEELPPQEYLDRFAPERETPNARLLAIYDAELHFVDYQLGRVLDALEQRGLDENTIVIVTADHGQGLGDHGWWYHRILYQEQIRVPLIVRYPGGRRGVVVDDLVRTVDVFPTVLDLVEVSFSPEREGTTLTGLMRGEPEAPRAAYAELLAAFDESSPLGKTYTKRSGVLHSVIAEGWKLIHHPQTPKRDELYHLAEDPAELVNVIGEEPAQARRLRKMLREMDPFVTEPFKPGDPDTDAYRRLKAMGYID